MTRNQLYNFINAIERNQFLRDELKNCDEEVVEIIKLAKKYGFHISDNDFRNHDIAEKAEQWFKNSRINPLRNDSK